VKADQELRTLAETRAASGATHRPAPAGFTLRSRSFFVWLHRWTGLLLAAFLILEGLTGALLAFRGPLERLISPQFFAARHPGHAPLDLSALAELAEQAAPQARIGYFSVGGDQAVFRMQPRIDPASGKAYDLQFDHLFLDPWTGKEMGRRRDGDLSQGGINVIPFIYELHMNLAAGQTGMVILGLVALAWTLDCFVGFYLTAPIALGRFLARWKPAWRIKWPASAMRVNFDLHRAGGLWLWPLLFVFAWSSVMFNLYDQVYQPVMRSVFEYRPVTEDYEAMLRLRHAVPHPKLGWREAQSAGERLMARAASEHGFTIERPYGMAYLEDLGIYTYAVVGSRRIQDNAWSTSLWLDGDTGTLVELDQPSGQHAGNTVETWLRALHFADLRDNLAFRLLVLALGLYVAALSITGIYIWLRKRRARRFVPESRTHAAIF
jgi:uncharacterized iron-regulated membrane protein